jgi:hypothetical protein
MTVISSLNKEKFMCRSQNRVPVGTIVSASWTCRVTDWHGATKTATRSCLVAFHWSPALRRLVSDSLQISGRRCSPGRSIDGPETRRILRPDRKLGVLPTVSLVYMLTTKSFSFTLQFDTHWNQTYKLIVLRSLSLLTFPLTFSTAASRLF